MKYRIIIRGSKTEEVTYLYLRTEEEVFRIEKILEISLENGAEIGYTSQVLENGKVFTTWGNGEDVGLHWEQKEWEK